ncbi:aldo/keto reductase [Vibrio sp. Of7-15]|uniref:aldo/keto reductase n=1 Tax=Vibrio sp. Of7-15 TaxID=2724879 RepID=UPI001EF27BD7|nr:aldo/keto reductase [Vibrio sp. Of7-15]MCG7497167.1 aldo/keto reductase [Vibrio sp. Of7-15]
MNSRYIAEGLQTSSIGYGAMGLSEFYGNTNEKESLKVLNQLIDLGINFIDTADFYGRGHNEKLIGRFLSSLDLNTRHQFKIATKCGIERSADAAYARRINNTPEYITKCCNESLKRLGVEQIDLFYLHRIDKELPIEQSMECLSGLVQQGKIKHIGLCEVSAETLKQAHSVFPISALQTEYSLWTRNIEDEILPVVKSLDIGLVPYSPLGRGFLTGAYKNNDSFSDGDFRKTNERFLQKNLDHNSQLLEKIKPLASKYDATLGQIALAWLLAKYNKLVPIPGTKTEKYLIENSNASNIILEPADVSILDNIHKDVIIKGSRYNKEGMKGVNV